MRILIIDNNIEVECWGSRELRVCASRAPGATVWVRRAPEEDLPSDPAFFDRIIVSGSKTSAMETAPWISKLHSFLKKAIDLKTPTLGVCYGHQVLVRVLGGVELMRKAEKPEVGWTQIQILQDSLLLKGLPREFISFSSHFQEVSGLPSGFKCVAQSERCGIQAFESESAALFGIQFHPERDLQGAEDTFKKYKKHELLPPLPGRSHYDPKIAQIIFDNFFKLKR